VPIAAKLSREFYDRFGDVLATGLVNWFNAMDSTYRSDLREFNESNFARFDAKLEQRLAQFQAVMDRRFMEFEARIDKRFVQIEERFVQIDKRFIQIDERFTRIEARLEMLDAVMARRFAEQDARLERGLREQTRWIFLAWATTMIPLLALLMKP
jgi:hypothetical protein